jgi:hypothetical protein
MKEIPIPGRTAKQKKVRECWASHSNSNGETQGQLDDKNDVTGTVQEWGLFLLIL